MTTLARPASRAIRAFSAAATADSWSDAVDINPSTDLNRARKAGIAACPAAGSPSASATWA